MPRFAPFIAVDWGTTNRRAYVIAPDGNVTDRLADDRGVLAVAAGGFEEAIAELRDRLGSLPTLMAGMIGSNRGWVEVPYVSCPADIGSLVRGVQWAPDRNTAIIPGLSWVSGERADVMRGEEVQLLGAIHAGLIPRDTAACHPGTHAKWAKLDGGAVTDFRTVMTGELFALLKKHSILAAQCEADVAPTQSFRAGVRRSLDCPQLTADLFTVRARGLLGQLPDVDAASYVSGLLIGADIAAGLAFAGMADSFALIGEPQLTELYAAGLVEAGKAFIEIDGETAFLFGAKALADSLW